MAISSLPSLIAKYRANFGISPQALADAEAKAAADAKAKGIADPKAAKAVKAANPANPTSVAAAPGDTLKLSPEALEYQKAHTSPTGKFQPPNLFGDMLGAFDQASGSSSSEPGGNSLMDLLGASKEEETGKPAATQDPSQYFKSLGSFLG